jgi:hypothetical protein
LARRGYVARAARDAPRAGRGHAERKLTPVAMAMAMAHQAEKTNRVATTDVHASKRAA